MNFNDTDIVDGAVKLTLAGIVLVIIGRVAKIFKGKDQQFDIKEFGRFIGFWLLTAGLIYIFYENGRRDHEWQTFDDTSLFLVLSAWLAVLHLDDALKVVVQMLELLVKLKSKTTVTERVDNTSTISQSKTTEKKVSDDQTEQL